MSDVSWTGYQTTLRFSEDAKKKLATLVDFVQNECIPAENVYHAQIPLDPVQRWKVVPPMMEELKTKAKKLGLWNLFLSKAHYPECAHTLFLVFASPD